VGIAPEDQQRIFEDFMQADGSTRRRHEGAGLGLAISQRFVELHGGRIWVESEVDRGSSFYFSLPANGKESDLGTAGPSRISTQPKRTIEKPILLAVTTSPAAAELLTRYVRESHTVVVSDLDQARDAARRLMPQAVLIDQAHKQLDKGMDLEALAADWSLPDVPFVICPLPGTSPLHQRWAVDGYLTKPLARQDLWDVLRQFGEGVDRVLVIDDDRDFVLMLNRMLDTPVRRYQVFSAYSAREGLDMVRQHDPDLVLLDLMLPDLSGFEIAKRIRSSGKEDLPIVIVSAQDEIDYQQALRGALTIASAEGFVPNEIVQWLHALLKLTTGSSAGEGRRDRTEDGEG